MSLLPVLSYNLSLDYPHPASRILSQHLGSGLHHRDLLAPARIPIDPRHLVPIQHGHYDLPWINPHGYSGPAITIDKDKFQVHLDVQQFAPEEITVKVTGKNTITIEGEHEEKADEHGFISRRFVRKYIIPEGHDIEKIESKLSSDGVLTITSPKINKEVEEHRHIPIKQTGIPSRALKEGGEKSATKK